jgi:CDP-glucose 4,6-dehydratase
MNKTFLENTYRGKKIFLTGHTGFKGAWLLQLLHSLGAEVKGYALAPQNPDDLYNLIDGNALCDSVIADLREKEVLEKALLETQPDFIFHLAAQPLVRLSYERSLETFEVNALGTGYLLEAVRKLEKPCTVVLITTDKVYENKEWLYPYRETDRLGGYDPYSASKACAEIIIQSYVQSFFNPGLFEQHQKAIVSARAGNVIGGGDWSRDRLIPDIVRSLRANQTIHVRNPKSVRPWQHVLEPLFGYLLLGAKLAVNPLMYGGAWNFGPQMEDNKTVEDLVRIALEAWGGGNYVYPALKDQPHEADLLKLDISKASTLLGWKPQWKSTEAISQTISWYRCFQEQPYEIRQYTLEQIDNYFKLLG